MTLLENLDKAQLKKILLIAISVLTLIALALLLVIIVLSIKPNQSEGTGINMDLVDYTVTDTDVSMGSLIIANGDHPYTPGSALTSSVINCQQYRNENRGDVENGPYYAMNNVQLSVEAMAAAHKLLVAAENAIGEDNILIKYAFYGDDGATAEYATGMLMLLTDYDEAKLPEAYATWLDAHAYEYGFVESFEDAYRYVGSAHAKYIKDNSLSLTDYVSYLKKNTSAEKPLHVEAADGTGYAVYYAACAAGDTVKVPVDAEYTISGTNEGGIIVTVTPKPAK